MSLKALLSCAFWILYFMAQSGSQDQLVGSPFRPVGGWVSPFFPSWKQGLLSYYWLDVIRGSSLFIANSSYKPYVFVRQGFIVFLIEHISQGTQWLILLWFLTISWFRCLFAIFIANLSFVLGNSWIGCNWVPHSWPPWYPCIRFFLPWQGGIAFVRSFGIKFLWFPQPYPPPILLLCNLWDRVVAQLKEKFFPKFPFNKHTYPVSQIAMIPNLARTEMTKNRKGG